ncbi:uncharacterized protein LOC125507135 [Triticum urartu]|uniref:uncharacterized protein LOC125507135 n=1 Tax=Triticum urartu TaxID=4572 RepID=UPI002043F29B|nr:uncharacterized protein LOC125507135 [Triticum urartu]
MSPPRPATTSSDRLPVSVDRPRPPPHGSPPSLDAHVPLQTPVRPSASASPLPFLSSALTAPGRVPQLRTTRAPHLYAMWRTRPGGFYGLRAEISMWGSPNQEYSQDSGASIQIYCQDGGHYNLIEAGFHVSPSLYHNRDVRFFTYWTKDFKSASCYNLRCKGFVAASGTALVPGQAITPPSSYGEYDHYIRLSLNKDPKSEDWVVYRHDLQTPSFLGYFPVEFCSGTPRIKALTGFVNYLNSTRGPPMGSGHFPDENDDDKTTAYFRHVKNYDSKGRAFEPITVNMAPFS